MHKERQGKEKEAAMNVLGLLSFSSVCGQQRRLVLRVPKNIHDSVNWRPVLPRDVDSLVMGHSLRNAEIPDVSPLHKSSR